MSFDFLKWRLKSQEDVFFVCFFGKVWGELGKNLSHPQEYVSSYAYDWEDGRKESKGRTASTASSV